MYPSCNRPWKRYISVIVVKYLIATIVALVFMATLVVIVTFIIVVIRGLVIAIEVIVVVVFVAFIFYQKHLSKSYCSSNT